MLVPLLLFLAGCTPASFQALSTEADAATALTGDAPWTIERIALGSTTDWDVYTAPSWAAQVIIRNAHSSGNLFVGRYNETGTFSSGSDEYFTVPAGGALVLPLSQGRPRTDAVHYAIPLASSTASLPVEIVSVETPE